MDTTRNPAISSSAGNVAHGDLLSKPFRGMPRRVAHFIVLSTLAFTAAHPFATQAASKSIAVTATVTANAVMQVEYQTPTLVVTQADVARGYCDAPSASRIRVSSNSRAGYLISILSRLPIFKSVRVDAPDSSAQIGRDGGALTQQGRHGREMLTQLTYRFVLADGVVPGTYPWPLALNVSAI